MATKQTTVAITRWSGSQHPSAKNIMQRVKAEGLRPYTWQNTPNHRYAVRSHNYHKVLYVMDGTVELTLPDDNQKVKLRAGDRIDLPAGVRHGVIVGRTGATCVEAAIKSRRRR
jgi:quercetin dioxygenase-like cupin family protein